MDGIFPAEDASDILSPSCKSCGGQSWTSASSSGRLARELAFLRSENAKLRSENDILEGRGPCNEAAAFPSPCKPQWPLLTEPFDDPFEPPPQNYHWDCSPVCSTPGSFSFDS